MGEVVELRDPISYVMDGEEIVAVQLVGGSEDRISLYGGHTIVEADRDGHPIALELEKHELKQLFIAWLALEYPEVINWDNK